MAAVSCATHQPAADVDRDVLGSNLAGSVPAMIAAGVFRRFLGYAWYLAREPGSTPCLPRRDTC